jgi:hypothetical protein
MDKGKTERKIVNEMEALQAMQAVIFDGSVALRHLRDVAEEQIPLFKSLLADQAVNVAASHEAVTRAHENSVKLVEELTAELRRSEEREEITVKMGSILWELMSIEDTATTVIDFISNVGTVLVNFDLWLSGSVPFAVRWMKVIHPLTMAEALQQLPLPLLLDIRDKLDAAITHASTKVIQDQNEDPTDRG